jgi:CPA1 family monovalent cation:H+ antiporter
VFEVILLLLAVSTVVIFVSLVLQGLSLGPLLRALGLHGDEHLDAEEAHARRVAAEAGLRRPEEAAWVRDVDPHAVSHLQRTDRERLRRWEIRDREHQGAVDEDHRALDAGNGGLADQRAASYRKLRQEMVDTERELDLETMILEPAEEDLPDSPYEVGG